MALGPIIQQTSVLDLHIQGALGTFSVSPAAPDAPSIPVKYIQTHISFDMDGSMPRDNQHENARQSG
jgi:hypothetical protein